MALKASLKKNGKKKSGKLLFQQSKEWTHMINIDLFLITASTSLSGKKLILNQNRALFRKLIPCVLFLKNPLF